MRWKSRNLLQGAARVRGRPRSQGLPACAIALALATPARAGSLDLDGTDGLNTTTIAKRERDIEWQDEKRFGAWTIDVQFEVVDPDSGEAAP